jgi:hypothetical protein
MASTYLSRTTVTPTNATKFTFSAWCKIADVAGRKCILGYNGGNHWYVIQFDNSADLNRFEWVEYNSGGTKVVRKYTSASLRDVNGYYHIVCKYDSTQGTVADRTKLYINGEVADLTTNDNPSHMLSAPSALGGHTQLLGAYANGDNHFNGIISHAHYCDGYAYDASSFGETDATTGEWKIKTSPSVTYGNNGFFVLKDGNSVTDQSGNSNNFTVAGGTLTKTEDNPSNVFATMNTLVFGRLNNSPNRPTFTNGNNTVQLTDGTYDNLATAQLPVTAGGNYYWEVKVVASPNTGILGIYDYQNYNMVGTPNTNSGTYYYRQNGNKRVNGVGETSYGNTYTTGDIIGFAFNGTSGTLWCSKNGTWQNSATISEIASNTTTNSLGTSIDVTKDLFFYTQGWNNEKYECNFGNGYFGTTAVSSAGTNASGIGIFEYDVPTGYTALSTKGLNL